jgi:hypothetical protein
MDKLKYWAAPFFLDTVRLVFLSFTPFRFFVIDLLPLIEQPIPPSASRGGVRRKDRSYYALASSMAAVGLASPCVFTMVPSSHLAFLFGSPYSIK